MHGDLDVQYQYGWFLIILIAFTCFVNLYFVLYFGIKHIYLIGKKYYRRLKFMLKS
jgi:hypothetical protein